MTPPLAKAWTPPSVGLVAVNRLLTKPEISWPTGCSAAFRAMLENEVAISAKTPLSDLPSLTAARKALVLVRDTPPASELIWPSCVETPVSSVEKPSGSRELLSAMRELLIREGCHQAVDGRALRWAGARP